MALSSAAFAVKDEHELVGHRFDEVLS